MAPCGPRCSRRCAIPDLVEQAFERLVEEGALEAAIVRWRTRPLTFAGDADVDLRLIALFDLTLADVLLPGDRLALCTDRYAYRLLGGRPAVALAATPGPAAAALDDLLALIDELVSQPSSGDSERPAPSPQAAAGRRRRRAGAQRSRCAGCDSSRAAPSIRPVPTTPARRR